ncbi:MAG TPA: hypothetical protein VM733_04095 [Thermoanaerobaculia bacterium]|nr:hypothetical protein [Thermoanaerobaculia bacterium]
MRALIVAMSLIVLTLHAEPKARSVGGGRYRVDCLMIRSAEGQLLVRTGFVDTETGTTLRTVRGATKAGMPIEIRLDRQPRLFTVTIVPKSDLSGTLRFVVKNNGDVEQDTTVEFPAP